jgi:hypothetical protein
MDWVRGLLTPDQKTSTQGFVIQGTFENMTLRFRRKTLFRGVIYTFLAQRVETTAYRDGHVCPGVRSRTAGQMSMKFDI